MVCADAGLLLIEGVEGGLEALEWGTRQAGLSDTLVKIMWVRFGRFRCDALGKNYGAEFGGCLIEDIVHDCVAIVMNLLELFAGLGEAALDDGLDGHVLGLGAVAEAHLQHLRAGREDEYGDGFGKLLHDLKGALDVDVEKEVVAAIAGVGECGGGGAVEVAEDLGPFEELTGIDHAEEFFAGGEVVLAAILFGTARGTRGVRDREVDTFDESEKLADQGRFARAGGCRDDEEYACHAVGFSVTGSGGLQGLE